MYPNGQNWNKKLVPLNYFIVLNPRIAIAVSWVSGDMSNMVPQKPDPEQILAYLQILLLSCNGNWIHTSRVSAGYSPTMPHWLLCVLVFIVRMRSNTHQSNWSKCLKEACALHHTSPVFVFLPHCVFHRWSLVPFLGHHTLISSLTEWTQIK